MGPHSAEQAQLKRKPMPGATTQRPPLKKASKMSSNSKPAKAPQLVPARVGVGTIESINQMEAISLSLIFSIISHWTSLRGIGQVQNPSWKCQWSYGHGKPFILNELPQSIGDVKYIKSKGLSIK